MLTQIQSNSALPVSLDEALTHLRITTTDEAELVQRCLRAAVALVEERTGQALLSSTWRLRLPRWPVNASGYTLAAIDLHRSPLLSVESVSYYASDSDGSTRTTLPTTSYWVGGIGNTGCVVLATNKDWPDLLEGHPEAVQIDFTAGRSTVAEIPESLRAAVFLALGDQYDQPPEPTPALEALLMGQRSGGWCG